MADLTLLLDACTAANPTPPPARASAGSAWAQRFPSTRSSRHVGNAGAPAAPHRAISRCASCGTPGREAVRAEKCVRDRATSDPMLLASRSARFCRMIRGKRELVNTPMPPRRRGHGSCRLPARPPHPRAPPAGSSRRAERAPFNSALERPTAEREAYIRARRAAMTRCSWRKCVRRCSRRTRARVDFHERPMRRSRRRSRRSWRGCKPEEAGERIGRYKLLQQIGEGGFGTVWMAEQMRAGVAARGAEDHQAGHGHARGHRALRGRSGRRWR